MHTFKMLAGVLIPAALGLGQENPLTAYQRQVQTGMKGILVSAAQKMPESEYAFRPVDTVRTFGEIVAHVADSQYLFCRAVMEDKTPAPKIDGVKASKEALVAALQEALDYCDKAYAAMTDAKGTETVPFRGNPTPKLGMLMVNAVHSVEHYGNLATYLRMKGLVPPTTEAGMGAQQKKK
jgi:uncharacterized damage-inducible protein DinB